MSYFYNSQFLLKKKSLLLTSIRLYELMLPIFLYLLLQNFFTFESCPKQLLISPIQYGQKIVIFKNFLITQKIIIRLNASISSQWTFFIQFQKKIPDKKTLKYEMYQAIDKDIKQKKIIQVQNQKLKLTSKKAVLKQMLFCSKKQQLTNDFKKKIEFFPYKKIFAQSEKDEAGEGQAESGLNEEYKNREKQLKEPQFLKFFQGKSVEHELTEMIIQQRYNQVLKCISYIPDPKVPKPCNIMSQEVRISNNENLLLKSRFIQKDYEKGEVGEQSKPKSFVDFQLDYETAKKC